MSQVNVNLKRRWTSEKVLESIRGLQDLSAKHNQRTFPSLYGAASRYFGSWRSAIEAAGYDYKAVARRKTPGYWNRERVIEAIRELPRRNSNFVRSQCGDVYNAALRFFGSWEEAIVATGLDYSTIRKKWVGDSSDKPTQTAF